MQQPFILGILSSPHSNSNSDMLARTVLQGAADAGGKTEALRLPELDIQPCLGCYACRKYPDKGCVRRDDMTRLYSTIAAADALVLAGPVYFFNMSGPLKTFLDRWLPLHAGGKLKGKRLASAFVFAGTDGYDSGCVNALRCLQDTCRYTGMLYRGEVYGRTSTEGELDNREALLHEALHLGRTLL